MDLLPTGPDLMAVDQGSDYPAPEGYLPLREHEGQEQHDPGSQSVQVIDQDPPLANVEEGIFTVGSNPPLGAPCQTPEMAALISLRLLYRHVFSSVRVFAIVH